MNEEYLIECWVCRGEFDAVSSVWCSCDPKDPSKLCPYCLQCFCNSSDDYKHRFWHSAPVGLLNERTSLRKNKDRLGELLVRSQLLTVEDLLVTLEQQAETGQRLGQLLVNNHYLSAGELDLFLEMQSINVPAEFQNEHVDTGVLQRLNPEFCFERKILPLKVFHSTSRSFLLLAMSNPRDSNTIEIVNRKTDFRVVPVYCEESLILVFLKKYVPTPETRTVEDDSRDYQGMIRGVILDGIRRRASDIHVEPEANEVKIRYRIDGVLYRVKAIPKKEQTGVVNGLKKLAKMDLQNLRMPQSSKIVLKVADEMYQLNTLSFPGPNGESISIKIVNISRFQKDLPDIGLTETQLKQVRSALDAGSGLILISGPLLNGVSTTQYAMMKYLSHSNRKIMTLESPVFAHIQNITQSEINPSMGFDFHTGLNSIIGSNPDVVVLSDVPDSEVANAICRTAGRCVVMATLNAVSAASTVVLLRELGAAPSQLSEHLSLVLNQRLVRRLCPHCAVPSKRSKEEWMKAGLTAIEAEELNGREVKGCKECNFIGYNGRVAIFEVLSKNPKVGEVTSTGPAAEIQKAALESGMQTLRQQCLGKIREGLTTVEEFQKLKI
jgi:type IV pilus assembly protein PilB